MKNKEKMIREFSKIKQEAVEKCGEEIVNKLVSALANVYEHEIESLKCELDTAYDNMRKLHNSNFTRLVGNHIEETHEIEELYRLKLI